MQWLRKLAIIAGGEQRAKDLLEAKGIGLILKSISVNFRVRLLSALRLSSNLRYFKAASELSRHREESQLSSCRMIDHLSCSY